MQYLHLSYRIIEPGMYSLLRVCVCVDVCAKYSIVLHKVKKEQKCLFEHSPIPLRPIELRRECGGTF